MAMCTNSISPHAHATLHRHSLSSEISERKAAKPGPPGIVAAGGRGGVGEGLVLLLGGLVVVLSFAIFLARGTDVALSGGMKATSHVVNAPLELLAGNLLGGRLTVLGWLLLPGLALLLVSLQPCVLLVFCLWTSTLTTSLLASFGLALVLASRSQLELAL
jgi:hypothetical protein